MLISEAQRLSLFDNGALNCLLVFDISYANILGFTSGNILTPYYYALESMFWLELPEILGTKGLGLISFGFSFSISDFATFCCNYYTLLFEKLFTVLISDISSLDS